MCVFVCACVCVCLLCVFVWARVCVCHRVCVRAYGIHIPTMAVCVSTSPPWSRTLLSALSSSIYLSSYACRSIYACRSDSHPCTTHVTDDNFFSSVHLLFQSLYARCHLCVRSSCLGIQVVFKRHNNIQGFFFVGSVVLLLSVKIHTTGMCQCLMIVCRAQ